MTRSTLSSLDAYTFDVVVIGSGINGASAAQHLVADGYSVLLIEAQDFGAGASSRSSRLMHFGLRYLDRGEPLWNYLTNPGWFITQCGRARGTMKHRAELVRTMPERMIPYTMHIPVYEEDHVAPWQMSSALHLINLLGGGELPICWQQLKSTDYPTTPLVSLARDQDRLQGVFSVEEYYYDWPERLVVDYAMDAIRMGAVCRTYTKAVGFEHKDNAWNIELQDVLEPGSRASIQARQVLNTAGPWIDRVLQSAGKPVRRQIAATKGTHAAVRLPEEYRNHAFAHFNRKAYPFYICPWRDLHYIGPTETAFSGDPADVRASEEDIRFLIDETNHMLPGLELNPKQILFHWSGVRPMPFIPGYQGKQNLIPEFNDHADDGLPNFLSIPGGPLMVHRFTGRRAAVEVGKQISPSGPKQTPSYATREFSGNVDSPPVNPAYPNVRLSHLQELAREEQPVSLADLLLRRAGLGWSEGLSIDVAREAAATVAEIMQWDDSDINREVEAYREFVTEHFKNTVDEVSGADMAKSA